MEIGLEWAIVVESKNETFPYSIKGLPYRYESEKLVNKAISNTSCEYHLGNIIINLQSLSSISSNEPEMEKWKIISGPDSNDQLYDSFIEVLNKLDGVNTFKVEYNKSLLKANDPENSEMYRVISTSYKYLRAFKGTLSDTKRALDEYECRERARLVKHTVLIARLMSQGITYEPVSPFFNTNYLVTKSKVSNIGSNLKIGVF